ncbi:MAG: glycosyltransferase family 2 protein, partial [Candidatus Sericytochromatia bacterium]
IAPQSASHLNSTPGWNQLSGSPNITLVIPCYTHAATLPEAVQSIVSQCESNWELVIVNDGSTDQSEFVAQSLLQSHSDLALALLSQPPSGHPAHARNAGIARSRAEWVLCLDADDQINAAFLASAQALIQAKPWIGLAYPVVASLNDPLFEPVQHDFELQKILEWVLIPTATVFRKSAWENARGYYPTGYEDWDFWLSCIEQGYFPQPVKEAVFYYRSSLEGVYGSHLNQDGLYKARIIERHPALFSTLQRYWAQKVLANPSDLALQKAFRAGTMPQFPGDQPSPCVELLEDIFNRLQHENSCSLSVKTRFELLLTRLPFSEHPFEIAPESVLGSEQIQQQSFPSLKLLREDAVFPTYAQVELPEQIHRLKLPLSGPFQADLPAELAQCLLETPQRLLLLGNPQDSRWEQSLEVCLRSDFQNLVLALWLPIQTPEDWLLDWLDRHHLDPETIPDLVLLPDILPDHCPVSFAFFEDIYLAPGSAEGLALQILLSGKNLWSSESAWEWQKMGVQAAPSTHPCFTRIKVSEPQLQAYQAPADFRQRWNQTCQQSARQWFENIFKSQP